MSRIRMLLLLIAVPALAADSPEVREVRVQKIGDVVYFHLRLAPPKDMRTEPVEDRSRRVRSRDTQSVSPARLVSSDGMLSAVYDRVGTPPMPEQPEEDKDDKKDEKKEKPPRRAVPVEGLEFVGKAKKLDEVKLLLIYPRTKEKDGIEWADLPLTIDLRMAKVVESPAEARDRKAAGTDPKRIQHPVRDDLEGLWASAQVDWFDRQNGLGFFSFAALATARKYNVPGAGGVVGEGGLETRYRTVEKMVFKEVNKGGRVEKVPYKVAVKEAYTVDRRTGTGTDTGSTLYETFTGAAAVAESLALHRMREVNGKEDGKRNIDIKTIQGIEIAEHPWDKMMAGKKPAEEPLASMIPHDNYYAGFKSLGKLFEFADQVAMQGGVGKPSWSMQGRDHRIVERYTRQLCLERSQIGKRVGGNLVKGVAVTGSDPYFLEGTDITLVFHVGRRELFRAAHDLLVADARKKHGDALKESKSTHLDIAVESFVTPLREVSLHRAAFDDYVVCSNSLVGLHRVLDAHKGKTKRLSESKDFQYMRTVFRADDRTEDGFVFMSDAFIRRLVGPESKIKEKRRIEALTSLYMLTNGALFTAWETGKLPTAHREAMAGANLKPAEVPMPEGKPAAWDVGRQVAFSDVYNTIHFATPLIELPMEKTTEVEKQQYDRFRLEYLDLWRKYFDPIGMRLSLTEKEAKIETYILPLIKSTEYDTLRKITGGGAVGLDVGSISKGTLFQLLLHLTPNLKDRKGAFDLGEDDDLGIGTMLLSMIGPIGEWVHVRIDDSPVYAKFAELMDKDDVDVEEVTKLVYEVPAVVGVDIKSPITFGASLAAIRTGITLALPGAVTWEPLDKPYRGVPIVRVEATSNGARQLFKLDGEKKETFKPSIHYAMIDGAFYLALNDKMLRNLIDESETRKKSGVKPIPVNGSLYLSPAAAKATGPMLRRAMERRIHTQALAASSEWLLLQRCGLMSEKNTADVAHRYLGHVPVSADGSLYHYRAERDEIVNARHGSTERPTPHRTLAEGSPLAQLLERLASVRADLRFREDGIHTTTTIERVPAMK